MECNKKKLWGLKGLRWRRKFKLARRICPNNVNASSVFCDRRHAEFDLSKSDYLSDRSGMFKSLLKSPVATGAEHAPCRQDEGVRARTEWNSARRAKWTFKIDSGSSEEPFIRRTVEPFHSFQTLSDRCSDFYLVQELGLFLHKEWDQSVRKEQIQVHFYMYFGFFYDDDDEEPCHQARVNIICFQDCDVENLVPSSGNSEWETMSVVKKRVNKQKSTNWSTRSVSVRSRFISNMSETIAVMNAVNMKRWSFCWLLFGPFYIDTSSFSQILLG